MISVKEPTDILVLEPSHFIVEGIKGIMVPECNAGKITAVNSLMELAFNLNKMKKQVIVMELYNHTDNVCDSIRFILNIRPGYHQHRWIILTDIFHQGISRLLSHPAAITLLPKSEALACISGHLNSNIASGTSYHDLHNPLSGGEWQILQMMVRGIREKDISTRLNRSYKTVSSQKLNIMRKLQLSKTDFLKLLLELRKRALT